MKRTIHTTPEEIRTQNSDTLILTVKESANKSEENTNKIIEAIKNDSKEETILGFTGVVNTLKKGNDLLQEVKERVGQDKLLQKLEEVKSAILASNITLKKVEKKEYPKIPEAQKVDFTKTNALLDELIKEIKKPCTITLRLK